MVRLRNTRTGVIVNIPDEKRARMGQEWEPVEPVKRGPGRPRKILTEDTE